MRIRNLLPHFHRCLSRWRHRPSLEEFVREYYEPIEEAVGILFDDMAGQRGVDLYSVVEGLSWKKYRDEAITIDPEREERRARKRLADVEELFGFKLQGEVVLFGAFTSMDGYARFDRGSHRVFLGVDESHGRGAYLDVLITHELTHVARESRPEVWEGFGLDPKMSHDEFTESQPVIEHLMGEGFSCVVSEILVPGEEPWAYAYQTGASLKQALARGPALDRAIREAIRDPKGEYWRLYGLRPAFAHYVWAWQWVKSLLRAHAGGDPRRLVARCSKDFVEDALRFELRSLTAS